MTTFIVGLMAFIAGAVLGEWARRYYYFSTHTTALPPSTPKREVQRFVETTSTRLICLDEKEQGIIWLYIDAGLRSISVVYTKDGKEFKGINVVFAQIWRSTGSNGVFAHFLQLIKLYERSDSHPFFVFKRWHQAMRFLVH